MSLFGVLAYQYRVQHAAVFCFSAGSDFDLCSRRGCAFDQFRGPRTGSATRSRLAVLRRWSIRWRQQRLHRPHVRTGTIRLSTRAGVLRRGPTTGPHQRRRAVTSSGRRRNITPPFRRSRRAHIGSRRRRGMMRRRHNCVVPISRPPRNIMHRLRRRRDAKSRHRPIINSRRRKRPRISSRRNTISRRPFCSSCLGATIGRQGMRHQAMATWRDRWSIRNSIDRLLITRPASRRARSSSIPRTISLSGAGGRQGAALRHRRRPPGLHLGRESRKFRRCASGRIGGRRTTCSSAGPICRATCRAVRKIRSAHARIYLGSTLYRIHGSNEPWTIGTQVSSGCIRLRNEDVIDLYGRVKVGTKVDHYLIII